jgi:hypothetical protein
MMGVATAVNVESLKSGPQSDRKRKRKKLHCKDFDVIKKAGELLS